MDHLPMNQLIQTSVCSIIYGTHKDKDGKMYEHEELFRCPRELDDVDIPRYVNEHRALLGFEDDGTEDLRNIPDKNMVNYYRMYYRNGWYGRWMEDNDPGKADCAGTGVIFEWFAKQFPKGCDWQMKDYMSKNHKTWGQEERYLIKPLYSSRFKIMVDTQYGNGDYPVRIYVYHDKKEE